MIKQFIDDLMLREGENYRSDCPVCKKFNTFSVSKENGEVKWNCYSDSCTIKGVSLVGMTALEIRNRLRPPENPQAEDLEPFILPEYVVEINTYSEYMADLYNFINKWELSPKQLYFDVKDRRCVFPIYNRSGVLIDATGRSLTYSRTKWLRYGNRANVSLYTSNIYNDTVVIVEDVISAITVSNNFKNVAGMALLGTNLDHNHIEELDGFNKVIIALDPDAQKSTVQYRKEIEAWTGLETKAFYLQDDLKYKSSEDMENLKQLINDLHKDKTNY